MIENSLVKITIILMITSSVALTGCIEYLQKYKEVERDIKTIDSNMYGKEEDDLLKKIDKDIDRLNMSDGDKFICKDMARSRVFEEKRRDIETFGRIEEEKMCRDLLDTIHKKI